MSVKIYAHNDYTFKEVNVDLRKFPAGETFVRITDDPAGDTTSLMVHLLFEGNDDLFNLALLVDAARRHYGPLPIYMSMPYLPYARQDRVCSPGESLSVKVVADFINSLKLAGVNCQDIHSPVAEALFDNMVHDTLSTCFAAMTTHFRDPDQVVLVSPDAGANKKVLGIAKDYGYPNVVRADKTRDVLTGKITGTAVYSEHVGSKDFLIVDDICDGGRTFIELAKELRKLTDGKIFLYVTHGIFSAGTKVFDGLIDGLYISNPVGATGIEATKQPNVTVI